VPNSYIYGTFVGSNVIYVWYTTSRVVHFFCLCVCFIASSYFCCDVLSLNTMTFVLTVEILKFIPYKLCPPNGCSKDNSGGRWTPESQRTLFEYMYSFPHYVCVCTLNQVTTIGLCIWLGEMPITYGTKITGISYHVQLWATDRQELYFYLVI
jgi:hypothetical protein